jgi:hypothetical protein
MSRVIRASIVFDYYPDEDPIMENLNKEDLLEYVRASYIDDIYSFVKYGELNHAVQVEIL